MDNLCPLVVLVSLVARTEAFKENVMSQSTGVNKGPGAHTIQNDDPYQGLDVTHKGHGKYSIIFEPLQNIQMSRSTYRVTSFIDFDFRAVPRTVLKEPGELSGRPSVSRI